RKEAECHTKATHGNVVKLLEYWEEARGIVLIMELALGSLQDIMEERAEHRGTFTEDEILAVAKCTAGALSFLHARGLIHRDVKPGNILQYGPRFFKVSDFGLSKFVSFKETTSTWCGTPGYMAPEIYRRNSYTAAVDAYAGDHHVSATAV
ncbi:unnamed protein product, partial [Tilletia controversa]